MAKSRLYQVLVRNVDGESDLIISFIFGRKRHMMCRPKTQSLEKTLQRISLSLAKKDKKKGKFPTLVTPAPSVITLLRNNGVENVPIDLDTPNEMAWQNGVWFIINDYMYKVFVNNPVVKKLQVPSLVMVGCPIIPQVEIEFAEKNYCKWAWLQIKDDPAPTNEDLEMASFDSSYLPLSVASAKLLHEGCIYWPTLFDLSHHLVLQCTPCNGESSIGSPSYCQTVPVQVEPELKAIARRQEQTTALLSSDSLRVVSYNILADQHAGADYAQQIMYPYCNPLVFQTPYRHSMLIKEILGYHPDVVCLQEVALKCFDCSLLPVMREKGYDGVFAMKTGKLLEGEAVFFHLYKYELVKSTTISLHQFIQSATSCNLLFEALQGAQSVFKSLLKKTTIIQLVLLKVKGFKDRYLLVANTHLCFHPTEDHTRLLQAIICTRAISDTVSEFKATLSDTDVEIGVMFCGDFNSCPCTGGYHYLTHGFLPKTHPDWTKYKSNSVPRCGCCKVSSHQGDNTVNISKADSKKEDEEEGMEDKENDGQLVTSSSCDDFNGLDISHEFNFRDACSPLDYTHYRDVFVAVLDYIFVDDNHFVVKKVISMPSHAEVTEHVALPSLNFPSDHLALICELSWK